MFELITDTKGLAKTIEQLSKSHIVSLDTEGNSLDPFNNRLILIQVKLGDGIFLLDVEKLGRDAVKSFIQTLKDSNLTCIGHNIKYDIKVIYTHTGIMLKKVYDTFTGERLTSQGVGDVFPSYEDLVLKYFDVQLDKSTRDDFINYKGILTQEMLVYSAIDVQYLEKMREIQLIKLEEQEQLFITNLEMDLIHVTAGMELEGIKLNVRRWNRVSAVAKRKTIRLKNEIVDTMIDTILANNKKYKNCLEAVDDLKIPVKTKRDRIAIEGLVELRSISDFIKLNFNVGSHVQLKRALNLMGVAVANTNEKTLEKIKGVPIIDKIIEFRHADKSASSFGDNWVENINPITGKIHATADQTRTVSGRYAYYGPALQQMKRENVYRHCFESDDPEYGIMAVDLSQAELRQMAAISREPKMIDAYQNGEDLHIRTGSIIFDVPEDKVTKSQRQTAKNVNFSLIYGISPWGLYLRHGIPTDDGEIYIKKWFEQYNYVKEFIDKFGKRVWERKMSTTLYGRKRFWKEKVLYSDTKEYYRYMSQVKREGVNHIIQGTVADVIKQSMLDVSNKNPFGEKLRILLQVHDELVLKVHKDIAEEAYKFVSEIMMYYQGKALKDIPPAVGEFKLLPYWSK